MQEVQSMLMDDKLKNLRDSNGDSVNERFKHHLKLSQSLREDYKNQVAKRWFQKGLKAFQDSNLFKCINCFKQVVLLDSF